MKFSVAMCVYKNDNPEHFKRAVESIVNQTMKPAEIILVVDGPIADELEKAIKGFENSNTLKAIYLQENVGLGNALKIAVEHCENEIIARMDADDISVKNRFEQQLEFFENNTDLDIVGGDIAEFVNQEDDIISKRAVPTAHSDICEYMRKRCPFNHMTVMFKKQAVIDAGGYLDWHFNEDYYLWIRMLLNKCKFGNTGTTLVKVRVGEEMYARRGGWKYFKSEARLQKFMFNKKIIGFVRYLINLSERLILQVLMPNKIREFVFKKFARE